MRPISSFPHPARLRFHVLGGSALLTAVAWSPGTPAQAEERRQIEEIIVTSERVESTVSDTSISITALPEYLIDAFALQDPDDLVNYIPASTRDELDIRIRGVGRNFRALGGDPGVATYYNGVYSPDFTIAASENALYDVARIEVLRGPQGTLYGRNSIGGALNYITNDPTWGWGGNVRVQVGEHDDRELYGVLSGPLVKDRLAMRLVGARRLRDGDIENIRRGPDANSIDDHNVSLALTWNPTDNIEVKLRGNDRTSDRRIFSNLPIEEGPAPRRGDDFSDFYAFGLRRVAAGTPGAMAFNDPTNGATVYGAYVRPGVDTAADFRPNERYGRPDLQELYEGSTKSDPNRRVAFNHGGTGSCEFPYTKVDCQDEFFDHQATQNQLTWKISDSVTLRYIFGTTDYEYTFNYDADHGDGEISKLRLTVLEDVQSKSHELQLFWKLGDRIDVTSGVYLFDETRKQDYSISDTTPRFTEPADYGLLDLPLPFLGGASVIDLYGFAPAHVGIGDAPLGTQVFGIWGGDPRGDRYHHQNEVENTATAVYTQATWHINDQFALVLGVRYAEDEKSADERRSFYIELANPFYEPIIPVLTGGTVVVGANGITNLAAVNIAMGNATPTGDPDNPIATCDLADPGCTLRLRGIPFSGAQWIQGENEWSDTNWRVNLDWTPTDSMLMYFSITTGYRAGGYALGVANARETDPETGLIVPLEYDKEEVTSYEIGYKNMHFDNTLQVAASLYLYDYDNYQDQVLFYDEIQNRQLNIVSNAPSVRNFGFELEGQWLATDRLTIGGNLSLTKTEYTSDYFVGIENDPEHPASLFGNSITNPDLFRVNQKGSQLKKIPETKATVWYSYRIDTRIGEFTLGGTYAYTGEYYDTGFERELDRVPEHDRLDLSVTWNDPTDRWRVQAFAKNVTNENNLRDILTAGEAGNWRTSGRVLEGRFVGVNATYSFGAR